MIAIADERHHNAPGRRNVHGGHGRIQGRATERRDPRADWDEPDSCRASQARIRHIRARIATGAYPGKTELDCAVTRLLAVLMNGQAA